MTRKDGIFSFTAKNALISPTAVAASTPNAIETNVFMCAVLLIATTAAESSRTDVNEMSISPAIRRKFTPSERIPRILIVSNRILKLFTEKNLGSRIENTTIRTTAASRRTNNSMLAVLLFNKFL